jgi:F-type H+-transporting ATPase subunit a
LKQIITIFLLLLIGFTIRANEVQAEEEPLDVVEMIMEHISDSHHWHIISYTNRRGQEVELSIPLPVILWHEGRPWFFLSDIFHHHEGPLPLGTGFVTLEHEHFFLTDSTGHLHKDESGTITNLQPLDFSITRNVASMFFSVFLLLVLLLPAARTYARLGMAPPKGVRSLLEPIILYVRDDIARTQISGPKADKFVPYLLTLFFFIFMNNLIGLVPFFPGSTNLSGNIAFTLVLAVISFLAINVFASKNYWKHIFLVPGTPVWVKIFLVPVEILGLFTKPFALMIRLFANITAGHIIILSLVAIIFVLKSLYIAPVTVILSMVMYMLEFLVALLQAYIFTLLTALFIGMATNTEEH